MREKRLPGAELLQSRESEDFIFAAMLRMKQQFRKLRQLKRRPMKPFAVMAKNLEAVRKECEVSAEQTRILDGHQKPILLLDKKKEAKILCPSVAPAIPKLV